MARFFVPPCRRVPPAMSKLTWGAAFNAPLLCYGYVLRVRVGYGFEMSAQVISEEQRLGAYVGEGQMLYASGAVRVLAQVPEITDITDIGP